MRARLWSATGSSVKVTAEPAQIETVLGGRFMIATEVTNTGTAPSGEILAHLNVASIEGSVYVDPEDWSSDRSQELSLQPGESQKLSWELQAVNAGHFAAYVVVVPFGSTVAGSEELLISPLVNVAVASRSTLTAAGALRTLPCQCFAEEAVLQGMDGFFAARFRRA